MSDQPFNPADHLTIVNGGAYLPVKDRLRWLREDAPFSRIETDLLQFSPDYAVFRATVTVVGVDGEVMGASTGHGSEWRETFVSYVEAAETKAIGRALAGCGYGTQFAGEFDDAATGRIADSPVKSSRPGGAPNVPPEQNDFPLPHEPDWSNDAPQQYQGRPAQGSAAGSDMSDAAKNFFLKLADTNSVSNDQIRDEIREISAELRRS